MPTPVLRFRRNETITAVPGDGIFITSETGSSIRLHGLAVSTAYPLLDASRSRSEVLAQLATTLGPATAARALEALLHSGHVIEADPEIEPRRAGYFEQLGAAAEAAEAAVRRLDTTVVEVITLGQARELDVSGVLHAAGLDHRLRTDIAAVPPDARFLLVITDDYLQQELRHINRVAIQRGLRWMLVKPLGHTAWIGPSITAGVSACFECLHVRLSSKNLSKAYFEQRGASSRADVAAAVSINSSATFALAAAAQQVALQLAQESVPAEPDTARRLGDVTTLDTQTMASRQHRLDRRPQCPVCGDTATQQQRMSARVELMSRPKVVTSDGGHRASTPEQFIARFEHFVSPITGPVSHLTQMPPTGDGLHVYTAGQNFSVPMRGLADLRAGLRSLSCGKGKTAIQAKASALGEAIERYSGLFHEDEPRVVARMRDLPDGAFVHPNELHHFSDQQFADQSLWNSRPAHFHWVGDPIDADREIEWSPVWSLSRQRHTLVPTSTLFYAYRSDRYGFNSSSNSNGCAAGTSLEDAILQGFFELVERDATAIWWYNRLPKRRVDLDSFADPYIDSWQREYRRLHRETWVLDLTTDLGIPTVAAISYRPDKPAEDILFSLGSHFDLSIAVGRALSEMNQFMSPVAHMPADGSGDYHFNDETQVNFWKHATLADNPYLSPDSSRPPVRADEYPDVSTEDLAGDVRVAQRIVERAGMELLVLDQTRVDIGLPVVRVMVPGMRHFWPRYAPGRLFDVPVQMGWLAEPTAEADLNPIGVFI